jgi:hypothetical protein
MLIGLAQVPAIWFKEASQPSLISALASCQLAGLKPAKTSFPKTILPVTSTKFPSIGNWNHKKVLII